MRLLLSILALVSAATALPLNNLAARQTSGACPTTSGDAPFSLSCDELASRIVYPLGEVGSKDGGVVFLVHGTGSQGDETWGSGPYHSILPYKGPGYDVAWFNSPTRSLGDAQITAEYIAYNIKALAAKSKTGKVFVIGHSQGNINIQWALAFFPSTRQYISGFSSLAGDFHGTIQGALLCTGTSLLQGGCVPSVWQQSTGSKYLAAQNSPRAGGSALVNTLSLYTIYDDIIQPEIINPTSELNGANNIPVQELCTAAYVTDHFGMTVAAPAFYATLKFLTTGSFNKANFNAIDDCSFLLDNPSPDPFATVAGVARQIALDVIAVSTYEPKSPAEPKLMRYVCDQGAADSYCK